LVVVDPEKLGENVEPPPILLSRASMDDRPIAWYSGVLPQRSSPGASVLAIGSADALLRLSPGHRLLDSEFVAPSLAAPENLQLRYRLDGLEEDWVEAASHRTARYPRLPAGNYVFRVTACNRDGVWNKTGAFSNACAKSPRRPSPTKAEGLATIAFTHRQLPDDVQGMRTPKPGGEVLVLSS
jgi:hypothetical protein